MLESAKLVRERHKWGKQELLMKQWAHALAVPTNDDQVKRRLRLLGEPLTYSGDHTMERRDRLRGIMAWLDIEGQLDKLLNLLEGSREFARARVEIGKFLLKRTGARIDRAKRRPDDLDEDEGVELDWAVSQANQVKLNISEIGEGRSLTGCSFSNDGNVLGTR